MKTILLLSSSPAFSEAMTTGLDPAAFQLIHRINVAQGEPLLRADIVDVCLLDLESDPLQGSWSIEQLRRIAPHCPTITFIPAGNAQLEEEAYLRGVSHVLTKPARPRMLTTLLERLFQPNVP